MVLRRGESATLKEIPHFLRELISSYKMPRVVEFRQALPCRSSARCCGVRFEGSEGEAERRT